MLQLFRILIAFCSYHFVRHAHKTAEADETLLIPL